MRDDYTDITLVLDRSGSMASVLTDTIGGFNTFVEAQRREKTGIAKLTLVQFSTGYDQTYTARDIAEAPLLDLLTYQPYGATALLDAMGRAMHETGRRLEALPWRERPGKVLFVTLTDGEENSSVIHRWDTINSMIEHQRDCYQWDFVFLGANQDAIASAAKMGIRAGKTMTYAANSVGTQSAFNSVSNYVSGARGMSVDNLAEATFTASDRKAQADAGVDPALNEVTR